MKKIELKHVVAASFAFLIVWQMLSMIDGRTELQRKHNANLFEPPVHLGSHYLLDSNGQKKMIGEVHDGISILAFWAPWCKYCAAEFPEIDRLIPAFKENNIAVIPIVRDTEDKVKMATFYSNLKDMPPTYITGDRLLFQKLGFRGFPTFIVIDKYGRALAQIRPRWEEDDLFELLGELAGS